MVLRLNKLATKPKKQIPVEETEEDTFNDSMSEQPQEIPQEKPQERNRPWTQAPIEDVQEEEPTLEELPEEAPKPQANNQPSEEIIESITMLNEIIGDVDLVLNEGSENALALIQRLKNATESEQKSDIFKGLKKAVEAIALYHRRMKGMRSNLVKLKTEVEKESHMGADTLNNSIDELSKEFGVEPE